MGSSYTLDITSSVGPLQEIAEFAHQLLILGLLPYPFLHRVASHIRQYQQHIQPCPFVVGFSTNANTNAIIIISGSL